jgi:alpha-beta hydrolase superfamily lysophospholipase
VLAVHGLAMHGKSYDHLGRTLALQGFLVYAIDLQGYGRSMDKSNPEIALTRKAKSKVKCKERDCRHHVDYDKSFDDLVKLARTVREINPTMPVFGLGESLGGAMVIRLAARNPELCDGLVLSAPAVKRHALIDPYIIVNAGLFMANPRAQLDLMPFVRKYSSDDARVVEEKENDPLLRRHLSAYELLKSTQAIRKTIRYVPNIPSDTPVLVIQGGHDRVLRADAVMTLLSKLRSQDQTVKWFSQRGHILLETEYVRPDTMDAVVSWLNQHVQSQEIQSKCNRNQDYVAVDVDPKWASGIQRSTFKVQVGQD